MIRSPWLGARQEDELVHVLRGDDHKAAGDWIGERLNHEQKIALSIGGLEDGSNETSRSACSDAMSNELNQWCEALGSETSVPLHREAIVSKERSQTGGVTTCAQSKSL